MHKKKQEQVASGYISMSQTTVVQPFELSKSRTKLIANPKQSISNNNNNNHNNDNITTTTTNITTAKAKAQIKPLSQNNDTNNNTNTKEASILADAKGAHTDIKKQPIVLKPFRLRVLERPSSFEALKSEIEESRRLECAYMPPKPKPGTMKLYICMYLFHYHW